jgi:hypothetical protein
MSSDSSTSRSDTFIFTDAAFASPLEELQKLAEKSVATFSQLADDDKAECFRQGLKLAHRRLSELLGEEGQERC